MTHQTVAAEAAVGRATVYRHWPISTNLLLDALTDEVPVFDFGEGDLRSQLLRELGRLQQINCPAAWPSSACWWAAVNMTNRRVSRECLEQVVDAALNGWRRRRKG